MAKPTRCPIQGEAHDHYPGEGNSPGSRTYDLLPSNAIKYHPVLAGQQICLGDIVTMRNGCIARVESASESGDGVNWGDVSGGAFMALAPADTTQSRGGSETVPTYTYGAWVETILDANAVVGSPMGVDLRAVDGGRRADRRDPVTRSTGHGLDPTLWQRTRAMQGEDLRDSVQKKAFLGRLIEIFASDDPNATVSKQGDYGTIEIQHQGLA